jgi:hypothetical protein
MKEKVTRDWRSIDGVEWCDFVDIIMSHPVAKEQAVY